MGTTWYFDGSGMNAASDTLVLSGVGAPDTAWAPFNDEWMQSLDSLGLDVWHSTDNLRKKDGADRAGPPASLLNAVGKMNQLNVVSFAASKAAIENLRISGHHEVHRIEPMLAHLCLKNLGIAPADVGAGPCLRVLFDAGEPFIRHFKTTWHQERRKMREARGDGWPRQIREIEPVRTKDHPGLQIADLISWAVRFKYEYAPQFDPTVVKILSVYILAGKLRGGYLGASELRSLLAGTEVLLRHTADFK